LPHSSITNEVAFDAAAIACTSGLRSNFKKKNIELDEKQPSLSAHVTRERTVFRQRNDKAIFVFLFLYPLEVDL
jgi:hypothetical protein